MTPELTPEQVERIALGVCVNVPPGPCSKACAICLEDAVHAAPVVAAMLTEARADERQRIAVAIAGEDDVDESYACGCPDRNPDNVPGALLETCRRTRDDAARIARGEA